MATMVTEIDMLASVEEEKLDSGEMGSTEQNRGASCRDEKIKSFYLVKFHAFGDPELESEIQEGFRVLREIYEARGPIVEEFEWTKMDQDKLRETLYSRRWYYRGKWPDWWCNYNELAYLQHCLQKLTTNAKPDKQVMTLSRKLFHTGSGGAPSLRREREIYREIDQLQHPKEEVVLTKEEEKADVLRQWGNSSTEECKRRIEREIKKINSQRVNPEDYANDVAEKNKEYERYLAQKNRVDKALLKLRGKLVGMNRKKAREYQRILGAQKLLDAAKTDYNQYVVTTARAKELGQKNCLDNLSELSNREIERFMSRWNNNTTFRAMYERSVQQSLRKRGLSRDGRVRNPGEEELFAEEQKGRILSPTKAKFKWNGRGKNWVY